MSRSRHYDELAESAAAQLPEVVFRYLATGARDGLTASEANDQWQALRLAPHALVDVAAVTTEVTLLGHAYAHPFGVAPTSLQRATHHEGEVAMAAATRNLGVPHVVSSNAGFPFSEIAQAGGAWWVQAYLTEDRRHSDAVLDRAVAAGASAVVLTADTPVVGTKYDVDDDDFATVDLSWHRCNYYSPPDTQQGVWARDVTEDDIGALRDRTGLPVVVKGVLRPDDAVRMVDAGAAAVWVSNHGGRQLDRVLGTASALPAVVQAVGPTTEVYVDGGIRSGLDVLCALALGARAAFLGRLPLFALADGGRAGVEQALGLVAEELVESLQLAGCVSPNRAHDLITSGAEHPSI